MSGGAIGRATCHLVCASLLTGQRQPAFPPWRPSASSLINSRETGIVIQAFFVGIVPLNDTAARVFTLEDSAFGNPRRGAASRGILCEWTANGSHVNYGTTLSPTRAAFVPAVARVLENPAPAWAAYTTPAQPKLSP